MQIVTYQKNRKVTKIKIHTKTYTIIITIEKIGKQVGTVIIYMYYLKIANYIDLLTIYSNQIHDLIIIIYNNNNNIFFIRTYRHKHR